MEEVAAPVRRPAAGARLMTDSSNAIFEPDVVLSAELMTPRSGLPTPERALLLAVLEDATRLLTKTCTATDRRRVTAYKETRDWFASTEHARLFDFENVCNVLGIDPDYLRKHVFAQCERVRAAAPPPPSASCGDVEPATGPDRDLDLLSA
jgi:hypothetical protein